MSTILDAIQKAEKQRQSDVVPSLEAIVSEKRNARKRKGGGWILGVIGLLLVSALAGLGYQNRVQLNARWDQASSELRRTADRVGAMVKDLMPGEQATVESAEVKVAGGTTAVSQGAQLAAPDEQVAAAEQDITDDEAESGDGAKSPAAEQKPDLSQQQREQLNQIELTVISYSKDQDKRFVMVGSKVLREGDLLEDFSIVRIQADGVVIDVQGNAVLIRP